MMNGEIWLIEFGEPFGSEPGFRRPAIVVQNDELNESGLNTTVVIPLTTNLRFAEYKGNLFLSKNDSKLPKDSVAMVPQIIVSDRERLLEKYSKLSKQTMQKLSDTIKWVLNLG